MLKRPKLNSLQKKIAVFLLLPLTIALLGLGFFGFFFAKEVMLNEWREAAILKLQRAAHHIDMRLQAPIDWMEMFHRTGRLEDNDAQQWILDELRQMPGVLNVALTWLDPRHMSVPGFTGHGGMMDRQPGSGMSMRMMRFEQARIADVSPPTYNALTGEQSVTLTSQLNDERGETLGILTVAISFEYIMQDILNLSWWQSDTAYLVDRHGRILSQTVRAPLTRKRLGETGDPLELELLLDIQKNSHGTILGPGHPPEMVWGYYHIEEAPWTIVLFASGKRVLAPILTFRLYYGIAALLSILVLIGFIRFMVGRSVKSIAELSRAAEGVAVGDYRTLDEAGSDEIGQLVRSFNTMVEGLKERDLIVDTFGRYMDPDIARQLMQRPESLRMGGEKREVAILMSDLRHFTPICETRRPEEIIRILNRYLSAVIPIIQEHHGIIVDFFGDGILAFFDPLDGPVEPSARHAAACAVEMQKAMTALNRDASRLGLPELHMGIGLHAGEVVVGNIGSEARAKYGIVGAPVNLTQRIQSEALPGQVVCSDAIGRYIFADHRPVTMVAVKLKGVTNPVNVSVIHQATS